MNFAVPQVLAFSLGMPEILLIVFALVLLFGARKLPELAKGMGKSVKEFKKAMSDDEAEESEDKAAPASKNGTAKTTKEN